MRTKLSELAGKVCEMGCVPLKGSSHHFFFYMFRLGDSEPNLHLPLLLGRVTTQEM